MASIEKHTPNGQVRWYMRYRPGRVLRLMKFLDALIQMSDHVASKGGPVPSWILQDVLDAGLLEARYVATARAAMARGKGCG
jgi:hypothetical protein